jgi:hypothetical protein
MTDKLPYELHNGPVDSPTRYVDFCIYQGRQTGKTHKLLMSIPNEPIVIVVWRQAWGKEMLRKLKELRPDYDVRNIKFVSYNRDYTYQLRGIRRPVYFDNAVLDMIQLEYVDMINKKFGKRDTN